MPLISLISALVIVSSACTAVFKRGTRAARLASAVLTMTYTTTAAAAARVAAAAAVKSAAPVKPVQVHIGQHWNSTSLSAARVRGCCG